MTSAISVYLEIVDSALDEGAAVDGVVEVSDVDRPDSNADDGNELGKLLTEFVEFLSKGSLLGFSRGHFISDLESNVNGGDFEIDLPRLSANRKNCYHFWILLVPACDQGNGTRN